MHNTEKQQSQDKTCSTCDREFLSPQSPAQQQKTEEGQKKLTNSLKLPHLCNTCTEVACPLAAITNTSTVKSGKIAFNVYTCEYYNNKNKISSNDKNYREKEK